MSGFDAPPQPADPPPAPRPRERRHLAAGITASLAGQVAGIVAAGLSGIAIARLLGPSGTGTLALIMNLFAMLTLFVGLGLRTGLTYMVSHDRWPVPEAFRTSQAISLLLGLVGGGLVLAMYAITSGSVLESVTFAMAAMVGAAIPLGLSTLASAGLMIGRERYEAYGFIQALPNTGVLVFAVGLAAAFGITGAVAGFLAAQAAAALIAAVWAWRYVARVRAERAARAVAPRPAATRPVRETFSFGIKSWGSDVLQFLNYRIDIFILNAYAISADVGVYSVAIAVAQLGLVLPGAFNTVLLPRTADLDAAVRSGEVPESESDATVARAARHGVLIMLPTAVALACMMLLIPLLYGPRFEDSVVLGMILIPGIVGRGLSRVLNPITAGRGYVRYPLYIGLITAPPTIALYFLLIPGHEAGGAALASTLSYLVTTALAILYFHRATRIGFRAALVPRWEDVRDYRHALTQLRAYVRHLRSRLGR
jgi:O-antigen/teichoic acid export membrane protein